VCATHGKPVNFATFLRHGLPMAVCQLPVSAVFVAIFHYLIGRWLKGSPEEKGGVK
jgi:hypothetical protein